MPAEYLIIVSIISSKPTARMCKKFSTYGVKN